jgi:hypothetical protein
VVLPSIGDGGEAGKAQGSSASGAPAEVDRVRKEQWLESARNEHYPAMGNDNANVDVRGPGGRTPLHRAAILGCVATLRELLDAGAGLELFDDDRWTALHFAALNRPAALGLLLSRGARVDPRAKHECTPLHEAARGGFTTCVRLLLDAGAAIEARTDDAQTALFLASAWGSTDVCELLLARGADPNAEDLWARIPDDVRWAATSPNRWTPLVDVPLADGPFPARGSPAEALEKALAAVPLSPEAPALALGYSDFQSASWVAMKGIGGASVNGKDARGRPRYVMKRDEKHTWFRGVVLAGPEGRGWMPIFTTDAAVEEFCKHEKVIRSDTGYGLGESIIVPASVETFRVNGEGLDGIIVNPYGPGTRRILSLEECEWIASGAPVG